MVLRQKGPRAAAKHDWRSEPEDPPVRSIESVELRPSRPARPSASRALSGKQIPAAEAAETLPPPPFPTAPDTLKGLAPDMDDHDEEALEADGTQRSVSGVRQKHGSKMPAAATVDEVTADLRRDKRRE